MKNTGYNRIHNDRVLEYVNCYCMYYLLYSVLMSKYISQFISGRTIRCEKDWNSCIPEHCRGFHCVLSIDTSYLCIKKYSLTLENILFVQTHRYVKF